MGSLNFCWSQILFLRNVIVFCGYISLAPWKILRFDAHEGSVGLGRVLPPCGFESEPYALPQARAAGVSPALSVVTSDGWILLEAVVVVVFLV